MNNTKPITVETPEFVSFLAGVIKVSYDDMNKNFASLTKPVFTVRDGKRYIRIFRDNSAHCFVDKLNGNVLKAASYLAPAKHPRGNVFNDDNGLKCMGPYGPRYLR